MGGLGTLCAPLRFTPRESEKVSNSVGADVFSVVSEAACRNFLYDAACAREITRGAEETILRDARLRRLNIRRFVLLMATFMRGIDADTDEERPKTPTPPRAPPRAPGKPQRRASVNRKRPR